MKNCLLVAKYSFREVIKSNILFYVALLGVACLGLILVAKEFTYQTTVRVTLDVGLGLLTVSCNIIAIFLGANLVAKEVESRTVYMIISRPVSRSSFLIGKLLGLNTYLVVNTLVLSFLTLSAYFFSGGESQSLIYWNLLFIFMEASILLVLVALFSLITNVHLTVLFSIVLLGVGHAIEDALGAKFLQGAPLLKQFLEVAHWVLPAFYKLNIKDFVLYRHELPWDYLIKHLAYGVMYMMALVFLSVGIFNRKNLD